MKLNVTFKRVYEYGGDCKADDTDYICGYQASNGVMIEKKYADGLNVYCWKVGENYYDTLNAAKNAVIRRANDKPESDATEHATPEAATPAEPVNETDSARNTALKALNILSDFEAPENVKPDTQGVRDEAMIFLKSKGVVAADAIEGDDVILGVCGRQISTVYVGDCAVRGYDAQFTEARDGSVAIYERYSVSLRGRVFREREEVHRFNSRVDAEEWARGERGCTLSMPGSAEAEDSEAGQPAPQEDEAKATADNAETEQVTTEVVEKPALVRNVENLICTAMYGWCTSLNAYCVAAGYFEDANGKAAYQEAQQAFAELQRMGYTDAQISALHTMRKPEWIDATAAGQPAPQENEPETAAESNVQSEKTHKLEIRRLKNAKFGFPHLYVNFTGWALFDKERGYVAFSAQRDKHGILIPYFPQGGKKALQAILNQGGFANYDGIEFVTPMAS